MVLNLKVGTTPAPTASRLSRGGACARAEAHAAVADGAASFSLRPCLAKGFSARACLFAAAGWPGVGSSGRTAEGGQLRPGFGVHRAAASVGARSSQQTGLQPGLSDNLPLIQSQYIYIHSGGKTTYCFSLK